jgi:peroxidase
VFSVDQNLYKDGSTRWMVDQLAKVLVKLSEVNVLTGVQGEIRKVLMRQV